MKVYPQNVSWNTHNRARYRQNWAKKRNKSTKEDTSEINGFALLATSLRHQTTEFFNNSTLHGVRYIAEKERPFCEKFMWFSFTAIGAIATCIIIVSLWEKFQTNPTITGLDTDFHNWDVPFPAVTICDVDPVDDDLMQDYIQQVWGSEPPEGAADMLKWLASLSYSSIKDRASEFVSKPDLVGQSDEDAPEPAIKPKDAVFKKKGLDISHDAKIMDKATKSSPIRTKRKIKRLRNVQIPIYNNSIAFYDGQTIPTVAKLYDIARRYSSIANGKEIQKSVAICCLPYLLREDFVIPSIQGMLRSRGLGKRKAIHLLKHLSMKLIPNGLLCTTHTATIPSWTEEMAGLEQNAQHSWDRRVEKVSFSVKHTYTTEDARQLSVRQRRCVFADEQKLETFNIYTYSACMRQCRMQRCRSYCKCVPHFYPEIKGYRYCTVRELECIAKYASAITDVTRCACELGCTHTVYEVEKLTEIDTSKGTSDANILETEFVSWPMVRYKREVLFGWVDLLVSFGGIAGLFLGFSLLSGVEIVYYFTLRAWCAAWRDPDTLRRERAERLAKSKPPYNLSLVPWWKQPPTTHTAEPLKIQVKDSQPPQYSPPPGYTTYLP